MSRGKKKLKSRTARQQARLESLLHKQKIYIDRGHDVTPVDDEIIELEKLGEFVEDNNNGA